MLVTDKQSDIAILRTLGASPASIVQIFMVQGTLIGVIGTFVGLVLGVLVGFNVDTVVPFIENFLGFKILAKDIYYISDLPSDVQLGDVTTIGIVSLVLSFIATLYPSWRASRTNPAEALRYE
jgi:lipoprotein-releasing system permease protein